MNLHIQDNECRNIRVSENTLKFLQVSYGGLFFHRETEDGHVIKFITNQVQESFRHWTI